MAFLSRKNSLERAMQRAARDPDRHQESFFEALLDSRLVVVEPDLREDPEGGRLHPVFSSARAARAAYPDAPQTELPAREALGRFAASPHKVVLNPGGDPWYVFDSEEVRALSEGLVPRSGPTARTLPAGSQLALSLPDPNPVGLKQALLSALGDFPDVRRAWLLGAADRDGARLLLGLELAEPDDRRMVEILGALDPVFSAHLQEGPVLDAVLLSEPSLLEACRAVGPPFYQR